MELHQSRGQRLNRRGSQFDEQDGLASLLPASAYRCLSEKRGCDYLLRGQPDSPAMMLRDELHPPLVL